MMARERDDVLDLLPNIKKFIGRPVSGKIAAAPG
jgi:hypothetical protein